MAGNYVLFLARILLKIRASGRLTGVMISRVQRWIWNYKLCVSHLTIHSDHWLFDWVFCAFMSMICLILLYVVNHCAALAALRFSCRNAYGVCTREGSFYSNENLRYRNDNVGFVVFNKNGIHLPPSYKCHFQLTNHQAPDNQSYKTLHWRHNQSSRLLQGQRTPR